MAQDNLSSSSVEELSKEDIVDLLAEDDKPVDKPPEKEEEEEEIEEEKEESEEKEEKEEKEPELELDEEEKEVDEELELVVPVRRKEILKKYPNLFKDFPYLEKAYYKEQQLTEIYPTIDDAKIASEKASVLDNFQQQLLTGNIAGVLSAVKTEDNEGFAKLVDNYLPTLAKVDQNAYYHVLGNVIKNTITSMVQEAKNLGENGKPLEAAALLLNQFVFGTSEFKPPTRLSSDKEDTETTKIQEERALMIRDKFTDVRDDLDTKVANVLKSTISQHIDPKESMTDYVRKNATREAFESLESAIAKDMRFRSYLDKLWEKAFETRFSRQSVENIRKAYLSKAKTLLPSIITKSRNDALRGLGKRVKEESSEETTRKGPIQGSRQASSTVTRGKENPSKGMKTIDFLMQD